MAKCVLFDCDGTLVDSERLGFLGLSVKFLALGIQLDPDELVIKYRGWKLAAILEELVGEHAVVLPSDFVEHYRVVVADLFARELQPIAHIATALQQIDLPKAVVSSGPRHKIEQALKLCGLSDFFAANIYSSYEVGIWKPDPEIYLHAARDMGFAPSECIVVDDGPVGVEAGVKAGMKTLFYNKFDESCEYDSVISFRTMLNLPSLIN